MATRCQAPRPACSDVAIGGTPDLTGEPLGPRGRRAAETSQQWRLSVPIRGAIVLMAIRVFTRVDIVDPGQD